MFGIVPLSIIRSLVLYTQQWYMSHRLCWLLASRIRMELSSVLILLVSCQQTCMTYTFCCVYSTRLLMMDRRTVRNMWSFIPKINLRN